MTRWRRIAAPGPDARSRRGRAASAPPATAASGPQRSTTRDEDASQPPLLTDAPDALPIGEAQIPGAIRDDADDDQERVSTSAGTASARVSIQGSSTAGKGPLSE